MSEGSSGHGEHLDSWGKARQEAMRDYASNASQAMWTGGRWNKVKSFMHGVGESAAEMAPHSWRGVAFDIGTLGGGAAITKLAKLRGITHLYHSIGDARTAGKILDLGRTMFRQQGFPQLARTLGTWHVPKIAYSAGKATSELLHAGKAIYESAHQIVKYGPGATREAKNLLAKTPRSAVVKLQPKPVVEQGIAYKSGVVFYPKSRQFVLPPILVTPTRHKSGLATKQTSAPKHKTLTPKHKAATPGFGMKLSQSGLRAPVHRFKIGLNTPKLKLKPAFAKAVHSQMTAKRFAGGAASHMQLHRPKLTAPLSHRQPAARPVQHRAPARAGRR